MELVEYCESNPNLTRLEVMSNDIYGKLTDIMPYCNQLETLAFKVKSDFDDSEYTPVAKLPKLCDLRIEGNHEVGSLNTLFNALAKNEQTNLTKLKIDKANIDYDEIAEVLRIQTLQKCRFNGNKGLVIKIDSISFDQRLAKLTLYFKKELDAANLADLGSLINITNLLIVGRHKIGTLAKLFTRIAERKSPKLEQLITLSDMEFDEDGDSDEDIQFNFFSEPITYLNNEEIIEVLKIKSLNVLDCQIDDHRAIEFPTRLAKVKRISIKKCGGGSLANLFQAFALQECAKLTILSISGFPLDHNEIFEIGRIQSLARLTCGFIDLKSINYLTPLNNLEILKINSQHQLNKVSEAVLNLFISCNGNISILYENNCISMDKNGRALTITMRESTCSADFEPLSNMPKLPILIIDGKYKLNSLAPLIKAFATKRSTVLQKLCIEIDPIDYNEVKQISQIKTLRYLECEFSDLESIKLLRHLANLEVLKIHSEHDLRDIAEGVLNVFMGGANEISVFCLCREITFNKSLRKLTISNISYFCEVFDAQEYVVLAELPNLGTLHIKGEHKIGSFKYFFQALAARECSALREISVNRRNDVLGHFRIQTFNYEESKELVKILTLKKLKCGFSDGKSLELLSLLTDLEELEITTYPEGSLIQFLHSLVLRESSKLQCLVIKGKSLTCEETAHVARVKSLRRLECGFVDGKNIELLAQLNQLKELIIRNLERDSMSRLFHVFAATEPKTLQLLNVKSTPISYIDTEAIVQIQSLRSLHCEFAEIKSIELLVKLPQLKDLTIKFDESEGEEIKRLAQLNMLTDLQITSPNVGSLTELFKGISLKPTKPILQSLVIQDNNVDLEEFQEIIKVKSLRRLKCGFIDKECFQELRYFENLEVLEITSYHNSDEISQILLRIFQFCFKLKVIDLRYGTQFVNLQFFREALKILREIRNPIEQGPLQLRIPFFEGLTLEQIEIADEAYLIISRFIDDS
ncbi:uncharacterized protein [Drosophila virilis]|nr:uncharacterized protein LOC26531384 isoform X2 [Drosophila virilis]KRF85109.1 uncharacterized protein Dvir_GJ26614, isoform B [Drosophila virilis]